MAVELQWNVGVLIWLLPAGAAYAALLWARAARTGGAPATRRQILHFALGLLTIWAALGTPLDNLADRYLFSAHMLQIVLLTFVAPPLLLLGTPGWLLRPAFLRPVPGKALRILTHPISGMLLFNLAFSIYLFPTVYEAALHSTAQRALDHGLLFTAALCMWWPLVSPLPEAPALPDPLQLLYIFAQLVLETVAFVLVTFAPQPLYSTYVHAARIWGLTALEDQQIGGAIMKMVVLAALAPFAAAAFVRWVRHDARQESLPESRAQVAERYRTAYHRSRTAWRHSEPTPPSPPPRRRRPDLKVVREPQKPGRSF